MSAVGFDMRQVGFSDSDSGVTRTSFLAHLVEVCRNDPRIVGAVDYGSGSYGTADQWSDADVTLFIDDQHLAQFTADWKVWAAQFGRPLLRYISSVKHPWAVYDTAPVPLRVDFEFQPSSCIPAVAGWRNSPVSVDAMVLYDNSGGRLSAAVETLVGRSLAPDNLHAMFDELIGDVLYYLLYVHGKLSRGEGWSAREVYHLEVLRRLIWLLRLEAGGAALERWQWANAAKDIERTLSSARLLDLERCVPAPGLGGLPTAMLSAVRLARAAAAHIGDRHGWPWPLELGGRVEVLLVELVRQ